MRKHLGIDFSLIFMNFGSQVGTMLPTKTPPMAFEKQSNHEGHQDSLWSRLGAVLSPKGAQHSAPPLRRHAWRGA